MFRWLWDTIDIQDKEFQKFLRKNKISFKLAESHPCGIDVIEYSSKTKNPLVQMIGTWFDDGSGDLSYMTNTIKKS